MTVRQQIYRGARRSELNRLKHRFLGAFIRINKHKLIVLCEVLFQRAQISQIRFRMSVVQIKAVILLITTFVDFWQNCYVGDDLFSDSKALKRIATSVIIRIHFSCSLMLKNIFNLHYCKTIQVSIEMVCLTDCLCLCPCFPIVLFLLLHLP